MFLSKKRSFVFTRALSFLGMCKLLLLNIKKLIFYNLSTECTSIPTNYNERFRTHSILENLQQNYFNLLMLSGNKRS